MEENKLKCAKCSSEQLTATKKGFSGAKALGGAVLTGGVGLLAGTIGSNKVKITCLSCGHSFMPGEDSIGIKAKRKKEQEMQSSPVYITVMIVFAVVFIMMFRACIA